MAEKGFGVKEINLIGASGTPTIESPNNLNLNAVNVAISTNVSIGGTLTVSGNLSIGGTITYEDVTNVDAIGIVTAREGVFIPDTKELKIGNTAGSPDLKIFQDGSDSLITNTTGVFFIQNTGDLRIRVDNTDAAVHCVRNGAVELYHAGTKKLETSSSGATVTGTLTATTFSGALSGNATSADTVDVSGAGNANTNFYVTLADQNGAARTIKIDDGLRFNASTNVLTAGTFSGSGASLTNLPAANITGSIPSDLQIPATNLTGTIPDARFPSTLPAISGANLTGIAVTEAPVTDYTVTANGSSAYRFHGGGVDETANNPDLYLIRGQKYRFNNTTGSSHPFAIRQASGGSAYSNGVTGSQNGIQFFTVPYDAPASLFYQCTVHSGMVGNIYIRGAGGPNTNVGVTTFSGKAVFRDDLTVSSSGLAVNIFESTDNHSRLRIRSADASLAQLEFADQSDADAGEIRYDHGNDRMTFHVGNNEERLRITSDGQLTHTANKSSDYTARFNQSHSDNPAYIEINGPTDNNIRPTYIQLSQAGTKKWAIGQVYASTVDRALHVCSGSSSESNSKIVVTSAGRAGIGTNSPSFFTHIQGDDVSNDVLRITARGSGQMVNIQNHSNVPSIVRFSNYLGNAFWDAQYNTDNSFSLDYGDSEKFRIESSGRVGVMETSPQSPLQVKGGIRSAQTPGNGHIDIKHDGTNGSLTSTYGNFLLYSQAADFILHTTGSNTERLRIRGSDGNVMIKTDVQFDTDGSGGLFGKIVHSASSYTANSNIDIAITQGNYIFSVRSAGVYHYNGIFLVTYYDSADRSSSEAVHGDYQTTASDSIIHNGSNNGTFRLSFNRAFTTLTIRQLKIG